MSGAMLPTLRQLQYLTLLAEHRSFSKAAEAAHVSQPALSAGIRELERALGTSVVDRARTGVILTSAGEEALRRARLILRQAEDLAEAAAVAARPLGGRFRLGVIPTIAPFLLPRALPLLKARHPGLRLFLREDLTHRLVEDLRQGQLDAALVARPYALTGLDWTHVRHDELLAVAPADHVLAGREAVTAADLAATDLILLEDGHCLRDQALAACGLPAPRPGPEGDGFAATSLPTLMQMVGSGLGVTFIPAMAATRAMLEAAPVVARPIAGREPPSREIVLAWRKGSSRADEGRLLAAVLAEA